MEYAKYIVASDPGMKAELSDYEETIGRRALSEKLYDCQLFSENADETSILKILLLYLVCEDEVKHEIKRIVSWNHSLEKAQFLVTQLVSDDVRIVIGAINVLGFLRERMVVTQLSAILDLSNAAMAKPIIDALAEIGSPLGDTIISKALRAADGELVLLAIDKLSDKVEEIPWKAFRKSLHHENHRIREEAFFAITIRKSADSAGILLRTIERESDVSTRRRMLQHIGSVPASKLLLPLLQIAAHDPSQKMRLTASRAIDRLQGILETDAIFKLRRTPDHDILTEVIFRLGKFGTESEKHKEYLRKTLARSDDQRIRQACIQALGYIADHSDMDLLTKYSKMDPITSYNATMALTRVWRLEDGDRVIEAMTSSESATQKQILLKYCTRRRGMTIPPAMLLSTIMLLLEDEQNINVRYLSFALLEYAPSADALEFIINCYSATDNEFEMETLRNSLRGISLQHGDEVVKLIAECKHDTCCMAVPLLPTNLEASVYERIARELFGKYRPMEESEETGKLCSSVFELLNAAPQALKAFVVALPDEEWKRFFLTILARYAAPENLIGIRETLIELLQEPDEEVRKIVIGLILSMRDPSIMPSLIKVAEGDAQNDIKVMARDAAKTLVEEWMR